VPKKQVETTKLDLSNNFLKRQLSPEKNTEIRNSSTKRLPSILKSSE